jgi:hypothetical protein
LLLLLLLLMLLLLLYAGGEIALQTDYFATLLCKSSFVLICKHRAADKR